MGWYKENNGSGLNVDKLRRDPTTPGRFIYTVDRHRDHEREFGVEGLSVVNVDLSTTQFNQFGLKVPVVGSINQTGERKSLPFKKSSITAGGDIHISTNKERIVFWDKTFNVDTKHITGNIYYEKNGVRRAVPKDAFVAFVRLRTGARIGVVTITKDGHFELNLREEYQFTWEDDSIDFYYTDADGVVYSFNYTENGEVKDVDLSTLYNLVVVHGKDIVLTEG